MNFIPKSISGPIMGRLRLACWNARGWFPWFGVRVYAPRDAHLMREVARSGAYELPVIQVAQIFAQPGTVVIDVGANLGLVSLAVLKDIPDITVHSYEPSTNSLSYLRKTCAASGYGERWRVHDAACADRPGHAEFHLASPALGAFDGLAVSSRVPTAGSIRVQLVRLDDEWRSWSCPSVSLIKIDVEGAEGLVCGGMTELITRCRPAIVMEWNLKNLAANKADPAELFRIASRHSLRVFDPDTLIPITSLHWIRILLARGKDTFLLLPQEMMLQEAGS